MTVVHAICVIDEHSVIVSVPGKVSTAENREQMLKKWTNE